MFKHIALVLAFGMSAGTALAEDWTGQTPPPNINGSLGAYPGSPWMTTTKIGTACCSGGQPYYSQNFATQTPIASIPSAATASNVLNVNVVGAYSDPASSTGLSIINAAVPLSAFARSTTVDNLAATVSGLATQQQSFSSMLAGLPSTSAIDNLIASVNGVSAQQQALMAQDKVALQGIASALAMSGSGDLSSDENYAVSANWGTFGGQNAFAGSFAIRAADHLTFSGGIAAGVNGGPVGGRAGLRFGW
jgi:hypothetical protein